MLDPIDKFRDMKRRGENITALTAYDYPTARLLDESGIDIILVGDSVGMVVLGYEDTTRVTLGEMLHHTRATARGVKRALLVADLPIHTYDTPEQAIATARELVQAGAQAVKLEGGASHARRIEAIVQSGIPVMAHIGMLPQSVREEGGYRLKGRSQSEVEQLIQDAHAVEKAGAFAVVLEIIKTDVATQITDAIGIPTIGIGSGPHCDGQILVTHDLIGLFLCVYLYQTRCQYVEPRWVKSDQTPTFKVRNIDVSSQIDKNSVDQTNPAAKPEPDNTQDQQPDQKKSFDKLLQDIQASAAMPDDMQDVLPDKPKVEPDATSLMSEIERTTAQTLSTSPNATHEQSNLNDSAVSGRPQPALTGTELPKSTTLTRADR